MARVIALLTAVAVALLPLAVWPDWRLAVAGALAGLTCAAGTQRPSTGLALVGAVLSLFVFAAALLLAAPASAFGPAFGLGAAWLVVLDLAYFQTRFRGAQLDAGVWSAHLAGLAVTLLLAAAAAIAIILCGTLLASAHSSMRPLLAAGGGLLVAAAAVWAITVDAPQPSNRPMRDTR